MTDYEQGRSDERASVIGEIEKWAEGKKLEYPYHDERFSREVLSQLISFLSSLGKKKELRPEDHCAECWVTQNCTGECACHYRKKAAHDSEEGAAR